MTATLTCDVAIVGGGLSGGLIALALAARRPDVRVTVIESGATLGGNHIWSFFGGDVTGAGREVVAPIVAHSWTGYDVAFPRLRRTLERLALYQSFAAAAADAGAWPVRRIIPFLADRDGVPSICIPDDLGFPVTAEPASRAERG